MTAAVLSPVTLVTGAEEFLVSRAVAGVVAAGRAADPAAEVRDIGPGELTDADLLDFASPSLFGDLRIVVVRGAAELTDAHRDALLAWAGDPLPGMALVVVHPGGVKGKRLVDGLTAAGARVLACPPLTRARERLEFISAEARSAGAQMTAGACRALLEAVGTDLRELASATAQLIADTPGTVDEAAVARFHRGRAETRGFDVADATLGGDVGQGLALLAAAVDSGVAPVLVTSALASGLRELARVRGAGGGSVPALATALRMPPWKVEKALRAGRRWSDEGLAAAIRAVTEADAQVKGAGADPRYALERAVVRVARLSGASR